MAILSVVAGQRREVVGTISAQVGMKTNEGEIEKVTSATVVANGRRFRKPGTQLTVTRTEAKRFGFAA